MAAAQAERAVALFREHDVKLLDQQYAVRQDEQQFIQTSAQAAAQLQELFEADAKQTVREASERGRLSVQLHASVGDGGTFDAVARKRLGDEAGRLHRPRRTAAQYAAAAGLPCGTPIAWLITMKRPVEQAHAGHALGVGFELLLHARRDVELLRDHHVGRPRATSARARASACFNSRVR